VCTDIECAFQVAPTVATKSVIDHHLESRDHRQSFKFLKYTPNTRVIHAGYTGKKVSHFLTFEIRISLTLTTESVVQN